MISTIEAKKIIEEVVVKGSVISSGLLSSLGMVLASEVFSPIDLPMFNNSAMDGYAIKLGAGNEFKIIGEIQAGDTGEGFVLEKNQAVKIFTGAICPQSADLVCRIEDIEEVLSENKIIIKVMPKMADNIRIKGEQIRKGDLVIPKGHKVNSATIGLMANLGLSQVEVYAKPKVGLLSTGNELSPAGEVLPLGKIYESNGIMLQAVLKQIDIENVLVGKTVDTLQDTISSIEKMLQDVDVLIMSGGISVGDYDFVAEALKENGVNQHFHTVSQKPGKPFYFGSKGTKLIFALPGNPAAVLTCYYQYVLPAIHKFLGGDFEGLPNQKLVSKSSISKSIGREQFLKANYRGNEVEILNGQSSAMLNSFATANALVYLPANAILNIGDEVLTYKIR